jgi:hypothetical protein
MTLLRFFISLALLLAILATPACEDDGKVGSGDGSDGGADSDADSDVDTDSDSDSDVLVMDCSDCDAIGNTLNNMLCAFDICDEEVVSANAINSLLPFVFQCEVEDTYEAVEHFGGASNDLAPLLNGSYALLATGKANSSDMTHSDDCSHYSANDGLVDPWVDDDTSSVYDPVEWTIQMTAPQAAKGFRFKYVFFSEEYDDYISSPYNDKFYVILNAPDTTGGADRVINYTDCRDPFEYYDFTGPDCDTASGYCCYVAINSSLSDCCWYPHNSEHVDDSPALEPCPQGTDATTDISGTGFECATDAYNDEDIHGSSTGWIQTSWPINGGEVFTITFHIHDTYDGLWDSEVILDSFQFLTDGDQGTVEII